MPIQRYIQLGMKGFANNFCASDGIGCPCASASAAISRAFLSETTRPSNSFNGVPWIIPSPAPKAKEPAQLNPAFRAKFAQMARAVALWRASGKPQFDIAANNGCCAEYWSLSRLAARCAVIRSSASMVGAGRESI